LIESKFLELKQPGSVIDETNSLGMTTYRNLLSLGYWKKLVYLTEAQIGLDLCFKFYNIENFKILKDNLLQKANLSSEFEFKYSKIEN